jgi:hypothetical protein
VSETCRATTFELMLSGRIPISGAYCGDLSRGLIDRHLGFVNGLLEVGIPQRFHFHKIYRFLKEGFKLFGKPEIVVRVLHRRHWFKLNEEVRVPYIGKSRTICGRTEDVQSLHSVFLTKCGNFGPSFQNIRHHMRSITHRPASLYLLCCTNAADERELLCPA